MRGGTCTSLGLQDVVFVRRLRHLACVLERRLSRIFVPACTFFFLARSEDLYALAEDLAYVAGSLFRRKRKVRGCGSRSVSAAREDSVGVCASAFPKDFSYGGFVNVGTYQQP